jgi:hypothetical protein
MDVWHEREEDKKVKGRPPWPKRKRKKRRERKKKIPNVPKRHKRIKEEKKAFRTPKIRRSEDFLGGSLTT